MLEQLATACAGIFAGVALCISVVHQPAAAELGGTTPALLFRPMYRRAAPMQAGLAVVGSLAGLVAWLSGSGVSWFAGAVLLGSVVPFTLLRIAPINDRLLARDLDPADPEVASLLRQWARLHGIRSLAGMLAFVVFVSA